jgi:hypothetical protein
MAALFFAAMKGESRTGCAPTRKLESLWERTLWATPYANANTSPNNACAVTSGPAPGP